MLRSHARAAGLVLAMLLISFLFVPASSAAQTASAPSPQVKPAAIWSVQWTARMDASASNDSTDEKQTSRYSFLNVASFLIRVMPDGHSENTEFRMHVAEETHNSEIWTCTEGKHTSTKTNKDDWRIADPEAYNNRPAGIYTFSPMDLGDDGWKAFLSFEFNPGYAFTAERHEMGADCADSWDRTTTPEYPEGWEPLFVLVKEMTGNDTGSAFTYHADGTHYNDPGAPYLGPFSYAFQDYANAQYAWSVDLEVHLVAARDLTVERLEVTQGIQDVGNSLALVQGRRTIVRAYIGIGSDPGPVPQVSGELEAYSGGSKLGAVGPVNEAGSIDAPTSPDWHNIDDTLNFELPETWTQQTALELKVTVNKGRGVIESNYDNNDRSEDAYFDACRGVRIGFAPIHYQPPGFAAADPSANIALGYHFMQAVYPVADAGLIYTPRGAMTLMENVNITPTDTILLVSLKQLLAVTSPPRPDHIYGWLPALAYEDNGLGWLGGVAAFGNDTETPNRWQRTFAHEVGHNYSLDHSELTTSGAHWLDVYTLTIKPVPPSVGGSNLLDYMVPERLEPEAWVSPTNWEYMVGKLCGGAANTAQPAQTAPEATGNLLLGGLIFNTTPVTGRLGPLYTLPPTPLDSPPPGGDACVDLFDSAHHLLSSTCFAAEFDMDSATPAAAAPFAMVVAAPAGLASVALTTFDGDALDSRTPSAHAPTVAVTAPNASGQTLAGLQTLTWSGADEDGDALTYQVLYSRDNGATWIGVGAGLKTTTIALNFAALPGTSGATGLIQVRASDGFHSAEDLSDHPFSVGNKPPTPVILAPAAGARVNAAAATTLIGAGSDIEDSALAGSQLAWKSSRDGALGSGRTLAAHLSVGTHTIMLTATDSGGLVATAQVQITVKAVTAPQQNQLFLPTVKR